MAAVTFSAIGGTGDTLKWYTGYCGQINIGKNPNLITPSPNQTTTYYARWESECDTSVCDSITIVVDSVFKIQLNPEICQGDFFNIGMHYY